MRESLRLSGDDFDIVEADRGNFALHLLYAARPDVVLLDISMPEVGGLPVCTEIKRNPATARTQIIVVSAHCESSMVSASLAAGASDYITKPFQPADLVRRVRRVLAVTPAPA